MCDGFEFESLLHHLFNNRSHLSLSQVVAAILVPFLEDFTKFHLLLCWSHPLDVFLINTESRKEVLRHDAELLELKHTVLVGVILVEKLFQALDKEFLLCCILLSLFFEGLVNEFIELK